MNRNTFKRVVKGLAVASVLTVYQSPGCSMNLDQATLESLLAQFGGLSSVEVKLDVEGGGMSDAPGDPGQEDHGNSGDHDSESETE
ncbi:MAG: hypothetical protein D6788_04440 [Planctomycetota bacterium]|nr:MAG: hypothetical protein D6788_04440 [Planctomycetota bacterium]